MIICRDIFQSITEQNWPRALIKQANTEQHRRILLIAKVNFITLVKSQNLTNTFKPFLSMLLSTLFQTSAKILHCYHMNNNLLIEVKVSLFLSLNISIYEQRAHNIDAMLEILVTTCSVSSMNIKYLNIKCHMPVQYKS